MLVLVLVPVPVPVLVLVHLPPAVFLLSLRSSSSKLAQLTLEQILEHMDNLRLSLSNTKNNCEATHTHTHTHTHRHTLPAF